MAARAWHSLRWPSWWMWLSDGLRRFRRRTSAILANWPKLVRWGLMLALGLVVFFTAAIVWQALLMAGAATGLALVLQQLADPSPLFWAVPWEAFEFALSAKARANHLWLHRTQDLARESLGWSAKVDGFATRDGFVLMGFGLDATQVRWSSELSWRILCQQSFEKETARGCKTARFLLALWLVTGGLIALSVWRGVDLASVVLLSALCSAAGYGLAGPAEKLLLPWAGRFQNRENETGANGLEVESFCVPSFLWLKGGRAFRVRQIPGRKDAERLGAKE